MAADGNELLLLATYIEENNNWLRSTLQRLGWTKKGLENRKVQLCLPNVSKHVVLRTPSSFPYLLPSLSLSIQDSPHLVQCTQNPRHLVPQSSADSHALRCQYASKGIRLDSDTEVRPRKRWWTYLLAIIFDFWCRSRSYPTTTSTEGLLSDLSKLVCIYFLFLLR